MREHFPVLPSFTIQLGMWEREHNSNTLAFGGPCIEKLRITIPFSSRAPGKPASPRGAQCFLVQGYWGRVRAPAPYLSCRARQTDGCADGVVGVPLVEGWPCR